MNQMLDIMMKKNVQEQIDSLRPVDIYINPDLGDITSSDFARGKEAAATGEKAARQKIGALKQYSATEQGYAAFVSRHHRDLVTRVKVGSVNIEIKGDTPIPPELIASRLDMKPGDTVDVETMKHNLDRVYGMKDYARVDVNVRQDGSEYDLTVKATEKSWGPNYLRAGIALSSDFKGGSSYTILADYTRRWVNQLGAEWKTQVEVGSTNSIYSEFWQPLDRTRFFFVMPHVEWRQNPYDVWINNTRQAQYRITRYDAGLDAGIQLSVYGEAAVGIVIGRLKADPRIGEVDLPETQAQIGAITGRVLIDQMDNPNFPNKGYWGRLTLFSSLKQLGADDAYNKVEGIVGAAYTYKRQTFLVSLDAGSYIGPNLPFYDDFSLGGFLKLSGLSLNQLHGQQITLAKIITYHKMAKSFFGDFYLGGSLETGNVWKVDEKFSFSKLRLAGSVFVGYDTIIGPFYLAYGRADGGYSAAYLYLGRLF
jgi:NTE family protein